MKHEYQTIGTLVGYTPYASLVRAERGESSFYRMAALTQPAA